MTSAEQILARCIREADCMTWTGARNSSGYGSVGGGRKGLTLLAHRVVFTEMVGPIEDGLTVDHLCRNKLCMNYFHMELVTVSENSKRAHRAQTHCKWGHPLSGDNVRLAKKRDGHTRRICRKCQAEAMVQYYARQKAKAEAGVA